MICPEIFNAFDNEEEVSYMEFVRRMPHGFLFDRTLLEIPKYANLDKFFVTKYDGELQVLIAKFEKDGYIYYNIFYYVEEPLLKQKSVINQLKYDKWGNFISDGIIKQWLGADEKEEKGTYGFFDEFKDPFEDFGGF